MTLRAVIYARYSTENQRAASIDDQIELCRRYAGRHGWQVIETYQDAAISGASRFRPGFERLAADAAAGKFDTLFCEAIDRLGRKLSDVAALYDQLTFHRVQVHTTSIGLITQMHVGIMGTMAQMTLSDLREKTRRGQLGRARAGRIPGGLAFGYDVVPPQAGSHGGARHWAIAMTLIQTAKLNGVESMAWLTDVLARIVSGQTKAHQLHGLLPWCCRAQNSSVDEGTTCALAA